MKLRIKGNSLRLRLRRAEVTQLGDEGIVRETIDFGGRALGYSLAIDKSVSSICARYELDQVRVLLPSEIAGEWLTSDLVSLVGEQQTASGETLKLLIEKDFTCLNPRAVWQEDQSDNYPNPHPTCGGALA